jgi:hypothetical protein
VAIVVFTPASDGKDKDPRSATMGKNKTQELHAKEVGVGNPSEERAIS